MAFFHFDLYISTFLYLSLDLNPLSKKFFNLQDTTTLECFFVELQTKYIPRTWTKTMAWKNLQKFGRVKYFYCSNDIICNDFVFNPKFSLTREEIMPTTIFWWASFIYKILLLIGWQNIISTRGFPVAYLCFFVLKSANISIKWSSFI